CSRRPTSSVSFSAPAPSATYTLSLHDALPISTCSSTTSRCPIGPLARFPCIRGMRSRSFHLWRVVDMVDVKKGETLVVVGTRKGDRKSTRLNSSHVSISYAVFCLKKKKITNRE